MRNKMKLGGVLVAGLVALLGCSGEAPQPAPPAPAPTPAATTSEPAPAPTHATEPAPPAAPAAGAEASAGSAEKHRFQVLNYAGTGVTLTVNGNWIGQWDAHTHWLPLDAVKPGRNEVVVELQSPPDTQVTLEIEAERGGEWVNLLRLNFAGKSGANTYNFVAR